MGMVRIECDEDQNCVLVCPNCSEHDTIYETDTGLREHQLIVEVEDQTGDHAITGLLGDTPGWAPDVEGFFCNHCLTDHLELPMKVSDYR